MAKGSANFRRSSSCQIGGKAGGRETQKTTGMQTREARGKEMLQEAEDSLTVRYVDFFRRNLVLGQTALLLVNKNFVNSLPPFSASTVRGSFGSAEARRLKPQNVQTLPVFFLSCAASGSAQKCHDLWHSLEDCYPSSAL